MRYLFIGIWHGEQPEVQRHPTDRKLDVADAARQITLHAGRVDVPDVILVIGGVNSGPMTLYEWHKNIDVLQSEFDESQGRPWPIPTKES